MRTRCPECDTVFRVTSEQLRLRAGRVRCGHCQGVFNAVEHMLSDSDAPAGASTLAAPLEAAPPLEPGPAALPSPPAPPAAPVAPVVPIPPPAQPASAPPLPAGALSSAASPADAPPEPVPPSAPAGVEAIEAGPFADDVLAAQAAGLVAARELSLAPGHERWSAGTLTGSGLDAFGHSEPRTLWPYVLAAALLSLALLGQLLFQFRSEVVQRFPASLALYRGVGWEVPLPRKAELVAIETSDLQFDNARGLFVLQATLRNRAPFDQAWPALELSLTNTNDAVVTRRVLSPEEYLPAAQARQVFSANEAAGVRLWVEARELGAVGYRLYVFYP